MALFHAVGVTPEAPSLEAASRGGDVEAVEITPAVVAEARDQLTTRTDRPLRAVSIGTPHLSMEGFALLMELLEGITIDADVDCYVNTGRDILAEVEQRGWLDALDAAGVTVVTDTCTYVTPILKRHDGVVMTDSGKWAWYAPGNLGVDVAYGSMAECVRSAAAGRVVRDPELWHGV